VANHAALEEGEWPDALCTVDDLIRNDEVARPYLFLQRSYGGEGDNCAHTEVSQRSYVGLVLDLMWCKFMM
jgi:hypothetical protein